MSRAGELSRHSAAASPAGAHRLGTGAGAVNSSRQRRPAASTYQRHRRPRLIRCPCLGGQLRQVLFVIQAKLRRAQIRLAAHPAGGGKAANHPQPLGADAPEGKIAQLQILFRRRDAGRQRARSAALSVSGSARPISVSRGAPSVGAKVHQQQAGAGVGAQVAGVLGQPADQNTGLPSASATRLTADANGQPSSSADRGGQARL